MKRKFLLLKSLALTGCICLTGCKANSTLKTFSKDAWSMQYDTTYFNVNEDKDYGDVTFNFYNEKTETAGSNYLAVMTIKDTTYKKVLNDQIKENSDDKGKIEKNTFGKDNIEAYIYVPTNEDNEDTDLKVYTTYTAIPNGKNVILLESFRTMGTDEDVESTVDNAFEEMVATFEMK